ncbi:MAG: c-type cytochrome [Trueperaceae bacterium]|nr:c-type cytochrome [Trueperaceae bacterium]
MTRLLAFTTGLFFLSTIILAFLFIKQADQSIKEQLAIAESPLALAIPVTLSGKELSFRRGCTNCHDLKNTLLGPSFEAISMRYSRDLQAHETLTKSLREGSSGKWAQIAMPVQPTERVSDDEAAVILDWVLTLAPN